MCKAMCSWLLGICRHEYRGLGFPPESVQILRYDLKKKRLINLQMAKLTKKNSLHGKYNSDSHLASFLKLVRNQFASESSLFPRTPFSVILVIVIIFIYPGNTDNPITITRVISPHARSPPSISREMKKRACRSLRSRCLNGEWGGKGGGLCFLKPDIDPDIQT